VITVAGRRRKKWGQARKKWGQARLILIAIQKTKQPK